LSSQVLKEILETLDRETRVYSSILKMSKDKTRLIVEGRVSELENIVKLEQTFLMQLGRLDNERSSLIEKLAGEFGISSSELTISALQGKIDAAQADELHKCQTNMTGIIDELKGTNELNSRLIKNSLEFIDFSINLLTGTDNVGNIYGSAGVSNTSKKRSLLDIKL
jgi:flagellar biosynthesis/type III secretory pathway chaperone